MQKCLNCKEKFKYKQIMRSAIYGYKPILCKNCGVPHSVTLDSRFALLIVIGIIPMLSLFYIYKGPECGGFLFYALIEIAMITIVPYIFRYKR
jgi:CXXC-20-CXXC protein